MTTLNDGGPAFPTAPTSIKATPQGGEDER
jgi:hypothetical protein